MCKVNYTNVDGTKASVNVERSTTVKATLNRAKAKIRKVATTVTINDMDGVPLIKLFPTASAYIDACTL